MNALVRIAEGLSGLFIALLTIPLMILGLFVGLGGGVRYFKMIVR